MKTTTRLTAAEAMDQVRAQAEKIKSNAPHRFPAAASPGETHRQGDLYVTLLVGLPPMPTIQPTSPRRQLAVGNTQGSRHCLDSLSGVKCYEWSDATPFDGPILDISQERVIEHPEHGHLILPPGVYGVTYQRDLDAEERERRVLD